MEDRRLKASSHAAEANGIAVDKVKSETAEAMIAGACSSIGWTTSRNLPRITADTAGEDGRRQGISLSQDDSSTQWSRDPQIVKHWVRTGTELAVDLDVAHRSTPHESAV